jgi:AcrR family transcriptional regulator
MTAALNDPDSRPLRRDAIRNQQRVLTAAQSVLGEHGTDATMELIASRAGVGVGTVYRHFPTKDALIDELVLQILADLIAAADDALARDDGTGLEECLRVIGQTFAAHRGYAHLLVGRTPATHGTKQFRQLIGELLEQAKQHGRMGEDVRLGDIVATIWAIRGIIETSASVAPRAWLRHLDVHLAALRCPGRLSPNAPVSERQLARITNLANTTRP